MNQNLQGCQAVIIFLNLPLNDRQPGSGTATLMTTRWNRLLEAGVNRSGIQGYFVIPAAILTFTFYVENKPRLCS
jgi:hypothetical protein